MLNAMLPAGHLEQIWLSKLLEDRSFEFDKVVGHHDSKQWLIVRVESDV